MNKIVRLEDIFGCSAAKPKLSAPKLPDRITLGMPHLSANGLSEGWLLKELGHRHWFLLAEAAGMAVPDFRTASENRSMPPSGRYRCRGAIWRRPAKTTC